MQTLIEGATTFVTDSNEKISRDMPVFYNPVMKLNRDLSLLVLATMHKPKIALPMEASGVRAARIVEELVKPGHLTPYALHVNDISPKAISIARRNVVHESVLFTTQDANIFLRQHRPFDYIDIDPFGTPNPFLDAACQSLRRGSIIAVTATDTSALAGTYPRSTRRKYWAEPSRTWAMHELGLRILIRKVQLVAAQHEFALTPLLSVSTDHYYRIFFRCATGVDKIGRILAQHGTVGVDTKRACILDEGAIGPLWKGPLHDETFIDELLAKAQLLGPVFAEAITLLTLIKDECRIPTVGFLDMHKLASVLEKELPKRDAFLRRLGSHGCRTHIIPTGFKTDLSYDELVAQF